MPIVKAISRPETPQEPGLRARNRALRSRLILDAGEAEFREKGFDNARMEDIATRAQVAPGTVYSYFKTKDNLLLALMVRHRAESTDRRRKLVYGPLPSTCQSLLTFEYGVLDASLEAMDRKLWQRIEAAWLTQGRVGMGAIVGDGERKLIAERVVLLGRLAIGGDIPGTVDIPALAETLHSIGLFHWLRYVAEDHATLDAAKGAIRGQVEHLCNLIGVPHN